MYPTDISKFLNNKCSSKQPHSILNLFDSDDDVSSFLLSNQNLVDITLSSGEFYNSNSNVSTTSSSSSSDSYKEIECLDNNIVYENAVNIINGANYRTRPKLSRQTASLSIEECKSGNDSDEPCIDAIIDEINNEMLVSSSCSLPSLPHVQMNGNVSFGKIFKCLCKVKCKCKCHYLANLTAVTSSYTTSKASSRNSAANLFESLSLDWDDVSLDLVQDNKEGKCTLCAKFKLSMSMSFLVF